MIKEIKHFLKDLLEEVNKGSLIIVSAGVAFYFFLSLFPAIAAAVSVVGLLSDSLSIQNKVQEMSGIFPERVIDFLTTKLESVTRTSGTSLGWSTFFSLLLSIWVANNGTKALFKGINIAYGENNDRNFFQNNAITLIFTVGGMIVVVLSLALVVAYPALINNLGLPDSVQKVLDWGRWVLLALAVKISIGLLYKYAPDREQHFVWMSWGSITATGLWLIGSLLFSFFVENFGRFNEVYGSLAAVIILMLYFNLSFFIILLGAEINAVLKNRHED